MTKGLVKGSGVEIAKPAPEISNAGFLRSELFAIPQNLNIESKAQWTLDSVKAGSIPGSRDFTRVWTGSSSPWRPQTQPPMSSSLYRLRLHNRRHRDKNLTDAARARCVAKKR